MSEPPLRRVVVVGASLAGLRTVEALRREGYAGALALIGDEPHAPYDRPPLSKQLLQGTYPPDRLSLRKQGFSDLELDLRVGVKAQALDVRERRVALSDGEALAYDALIIATGAAPRRLPFGHGLAGVHVLRTLDDALAIAQSLAASPRVCVIGAGFIGLEVAASCRKLGLSVTAIERAPRPLADKLGDAMADVVVDLHRAHGVTLRLDTQVSALEGKGRVERVRLGDGSAIEADLVVVGIGVAPNTAWLEGSGVALRDGVLCDERCAASVPGVYAAGDVARWPNTLFGEVMRVEHWTHAVEQANAVAARVLHGAEATPPFAPAPYFWSDQYDLKLQFAGSYRPGDTLHVLEHSPADRRLCALYARAERLVGVLTLGRPAQLIKYRRLIEQRAAIETARVAY